MRGVGTTYFIPQILEKTIVFLAAADVENLEYSKTMASLASFVSSHGDLDGAELRQRFHDEVKRIHTGT